MLLGIDLGTSSLRAAIVNQQGYICSIGQQEYAINACQPGWAEQDVESWWHALVLATRQALAAATVKPEQIKGISFSGQMHGTVLADTNGKALAPAIIWADSRSAGQAAALNQQIGEEQLARIAGNRVSPGFMAATAAWLHENQPKLLARSAYLLLPKDYLRFRMTGEAMAEPSDASSSLLFDIGTGDWSALLAATVGVDLAKLPPIVQSTAICGHLTRTVAEEMGLPAGLPVVAGVADQAAQAVGNGIIGPEEASSTIGTGGQLLQPVLAAKADEKLRLHCFCHAAPRTWYLMAAILSAGLSLRWWRDLLALSGPEAYSHLSTDAEAAGVGAHGLLYLPYLLGERTPHMDAEARGAFIGLTLRHQHGDLARAIMEGVAFALRDGMEIMRQLAPNPRRLIASGGGAKSAIWRQIQADILGLPITTVAGDERAVAGAAMLAGIGVGIYANFSEARSACVRYGPVVEPIASNVTAYNDLYEQYRQLYPALKSSFSALCRFERRVNQ